MLTMSIVIIGIFALPGMTVVATIDYSFRSRINPIIFEWKDSTELSETLTTQHEAELARIAAEEAAALAELEALEAIQTSEQLTPYQLQVYVMTYGCTPEQRRDIESGGDYGANTGNGYLGAYQFAAQYNAGRWEACFGTPYPGHDVFLADSAAQDALANWYAETRYGGWQNVPAYGGW